MKKLIYLSFSLSLFILASCTKDLTNLNEQTKAPANVPAGTLFSNATRSLSDPLASASVNTDVFRFIVKHWAMVTYQDEVQYDFTTRFIPRSWWSIMYRDVLNDLQNSAQLITDDANLTDGEKANKLAIIDAMQVYTYSILVNTFGDVPYSEALNSTILFPKYDDAKTIYADLLTRISADITKMNATASGFSATEDLLNKGSMTKWIKFANGLKMKLALTIADEDDATAKSAVEAVSANAITSAADNSIFVYLTGSPNQNPLYADIVTGGRGDYVATQDFVDTLARLVDPRLSKYFSPNAAGLYKGGISGAVNSPQSDYSQPGAKVIAPDAGNIFMDYAEAEFYRAEAVERGYSIPGTAAEHYSNAITASILYWGGTAAEATAYLANPAVNYATAAGTWKQKIGTQKWIANFNRPYEAWTELRKFDFPVLTLPVAAKSGFPNRLTYPDTEATTNGDNYTSAASKIGTDKVETKLFWDKF
ncbi:MAG: SusD/RagB family nutrient-binding outer membrane lipoprotein [Ferruginibacter sp.]